MDWGMIMQFREPIVLGLSAGVVGNFMWAWKLAGEWYRG